MIHIDELFVAQAVRPGTRLSDLMPQHAIFGGPTAPALLCGGPGGLSDPWKALSVSWDAGTVYGWPNRVSPWEV